MIIIIIVITLLVDLLHYRSIYYITGCNKRAAARSGLLSLRLMYESFLVLCTVFKYGATLMLQILSV